MPTPLKALRHNLLEIQSLSETHVLDPELELVSNSSETHVYNSHHGWGRIWTWIYWIQAFFGKTTVRRDHLIQTLLKIQKTFIERQTKADKAIEVVQEAFHSHIKDQKKYKKALKDLDKWMQNIHPFAKRLSEKNGVHFLEPMKWAANEVGNKDPQIDHTSKDFPLYKEYHRILCFRLLIGCETPFKVFNKLIGGGALTGSETKDLNLWIGRVQDLAPQNCKKKPKYSEITPKFLHKILKTIAKHPDDDDPLTLEKLETALGYFGLDLLNKPDYKSLKFRENLFTGSILEGSGNQSWELEGELPGKTLNKIDTKIVYTLKNEPRWVAVFPMSPALQGMDELKIVGFQSAVPYAMIFYKDPKDRFYLMERLYHTLEDVSYQYKLSAVRNKELLKPLIMLAKGFKELSAFPSDLSPAYFRLNHDAELRALHPLVAGDRNFMRIVNFFYKCCLDKQEVFRDFLMESGLASDQGNKLYCTLVKTALGLENSDFKKVMQDQDPLLEKEAKTFYEEVKHLYDRCFKELTILYKVTDKPRLERALSKGILEYWNINCIGSLLWPDMAEKIVNSIVIQLQLKKI